MAAFKKYHDGWAKLAAAIIRSGQQTSDTSFLESDWCADLMEMCRLDDLLHDRNINIDTSNWRGTW